MGGDAVEAGKGVERTLQCMASAVSSGDFERWRELWHPGARELAPNTPVTIGPANLLFGAEAWFEQWDHDMSICCHEVQVVRSWAFASGRLTLRTVSRWEEKTRLLAGQFLAVLIDRGDGHWLMYRYCYNSSVPLAGDS
jgi:ketosteroid isomerase-like protein